MVWFPFLGAVAPVAGCRASGVAVAVDVAVDIAIYVAVGIVVVVDVDVAVVPVAVIGDNGADRHAGPEGEQRGISWIISVHVGGRRRIDDGWVVLRDVDDLGVGGLDNDGLRRLLNHRDLWAGLQIACCLGLGAEGLHGLHYVGLLVVVCLAKR